LGRDAGLSTDQLDGIMQQSTTGSPDTPELLLADARLALAAPSVEADWRSANRDVRRAVLLAAIASEVKIKTTLVGKATAPARSAAQRDADDRRIATADLVHKPMKVALGRSLHEEQAVLFKAVSELFQARNKVAHRGVELNVEDARTYTQTAVDLFTWLESVP
jgi:hypothetical protein